MRIEDRESKMELRMKGLFLVRGSLFLVLPVVGGAMERKERVVGGCSGL